MELTKEQRKFYEETREMARKEIEDIERKIEDSTMARGHAPLTTRVLAIQ